jgi:hypothetical protein
MNVWQRFDQRSLWNGLGVVAAVGLIPGFAGWALWPRPAAEIRAREFELDNRPYLRIETGKMKFNFQPLQITFDGPPTVAPGSAILFQEYFGSGLLFRPLGQSPKRYYRIARQNRRHSKDETGLSVTPHLSLDRISSFPAGRKPWLLPCTSVARNSI